MPTSFNQFARDESGVAAIEYALLGGLIALVIIGAAGLVGVSLLARFTAVAGGFS